MTSQNISTNPEDIDIPHDAVQSQGPVRIIQTKDLKEVIEVETGFGDSNLWLEWIQYTARSVVKEECYACATAKPQLTTIPFPLDGRNSPRGMACMVKLFMKAGKPDNDSCTDLHYLYPHVPIRSRLRPFTVAGGDYYCLTRYNTHGRNVGEVGTCNRTENVTTTETMRDLTGWLSPKDFSKIKSPRADVWWMCGGKKLWPSLPTNWTGTCALVQFGMPFTLIQHKDLVPGRRERRVAPSGSFDDRVYLDSIGVPRGVPDEFKAMNQIWAGLKSSIFWWSTLNKNVDWINYIYYNQQRFINYTRDAIQVLAEQTAATTLMVLQNRIALDMLLAEKGGVCVIFGSECCTFIPENTALDGSVTKALAGLNNLAQEL
ncbi:syncytin-1-like [Salmo trutta]|uniref:syncytin-1-like n=1 Tax=Salmo trutta TaxID=8032 RepID=UPI001131C1FE|nr:syncytin-1-like [Salmo trutta]